MGILDENPTVTNFWKLYRGTFDSLYLYCARRATMKPVIAFIMKSLYENAYGEMKDGQEIVLLDLYRWAYEFFAAQTQSGSTGGAVKRVHDFQDVYEVKTDSGSRAIKREQLLENFYSHLNFKEREVLWLAFFEELSGAQRAIVMGMDEEECTKFYHEAMKKAKEIVGLATSHQRGFAALVSYFGGAASLLKRAKLQEDITIDQEIYSSLKNLFMEQFERSSAGAAATISEQVVKAVAPIAEKKDEFLDEFEDEGITPAGLWRRLQGVVALALVVATGAIGYFQFLSVDARVERLLVDDRTQFTDGFNVAQRESFTREALRHLVRGREYDFVQMSRRGGMVQVTFGDGKNREAFLVYPEAQKFDYRFAWQPKEYAKKVL
jgi:hypothetical protein